MIRDRRTPYQQEMDRIHVPPIAASRTLRMMLEENRRLRLKKKPEKELSRIYRKK